MGIHEVLFPEMLKRYKDGQIKKVDLLNYMNNGDTYHPAYFEHADVDADGKATTGGQSPKAIIDGLKNDPKSD